MFAVGLAAALGASALFSLGVTLQALEARRAPREEGLRLALLTRLLGRPRWVFGLTLGGLGFLLEVLAFENAPFVVVQPALAAGLLLLLALGVRTLHERVGRAEVLGVLEQAITGGTGRYARATGTVTVDQRQGGDRFTFHIHTSAR